MTCSCRRGEKIANEVPLKIKRLHPDAVIPAYQSEGAAGFDLHAVESVEAPSGKTVMVKTGLSVEVPPGYELQIRPRSGVSLKTGLMVKNSPGTIDSDYRGEVCIIIYNNGEWFGGHYINKGDRIAQAVLKRVERAAIQEVEELSTTVRGTGGLGSTGV